MILKIRVEADNYETVNTLLDILKEKYEKVFWTVGIKKNASVLHLVFNRDGRIEAWEGGIVAGISAWNGKIEGEHEG